MTTTPRLGAPELVSGQAVPETTVNEQVRYVEQGACQFTVKDKDLTAPPGSPADGDAYIVGGSPTGAWSGWANRIAFYVNTSWDSITPKEGFYAEVIDEDVLYRFNGTSWAAVSSSGGGPSWERVVVVAKSGGNYTSIQSAINSISDAAANKIYTVLVCPGIYAEQVTMASYINVVGLDRDACQIEYASSSGAVIMASYCQLHNIRIRQTANATDWGIVLTNKTNVGMRDIEFTPPTGTEPSNGIKITGSSWMTVLIERYVYSGFGANAVGLQIEGNSAAPQNSDFHLNDALIDNFSAGASGGCVVIKDCYAARFRNCVFRTSASGFCLKSSRTSTGTVDYALEAVTMEAGQGLVVGANTNAYLYHSRCETITNSGVVYTGRPLGKQLQNSGSNAFSWVNQGSATITDQNNEMHLSAPATAGDSLRMQVATAPATPYTITAAIRLKVPPINFAGAGICFRDSASGKVHSFGLSFENDLLALRSSKWTNQTTFSAHYALTGSITNGGTFFRGDLIWLRIADDGTNRKCSISNDGVNFIQVHSVGRTDHLTANQVGFYANASQATYDCGISIANWS